jgi:maltooligosyltrehalose trehalohydrolase
VIYECHIGTLTQDGTFDSAIRELPRLRALGVTAVEVMPVASAPGSRNWGYDGAALFAPSANYGGPEGLRRFVDAAHGEGLAVLLDVVYNHFGPDGNYTGYFSPYYLTDRYHTPWGCAVNFDQPGSDGVRLFVLENLLHWHHEFHVDGFRFDAADQIHADSPTHILAEARTSLSRERGDRPEPYLVAEAHERDARYVVPVPEGGFGFDAVWADEFHHEVRNLLHPQREGYLQSFAGTGAELAETIAGGFLRPTGKFRELGRAVPWGSYVYCIQNHDQVGNRAFGERLQVTSSLEAAAAAAVLLLLLPQTPLIFQGQEFAATTPFLFFTDHNPELGAQVTAGRREEFAAFAAFHDPELRARIPDPQAESTFLASKLQPSDIVSTVGVQTTALYSELLRCRHRDTVLAASRAARLPLATAASGNALSVRVASGTGERLMAVNLGAQAATLPAAHAWRCLLHSREARFGGDGQAPISTHSRVELPPFSGAYFEPSS